MSDKAQLSDEVTKSMNLDDNADSHRTLSQADIERITVQRIKNGDEDEWRLFIERYEGRLLAFASGRLKDRNEAEDIVQETFLGFLRSLPNFINDRPLESYLFSIASYKIADVYRKKSKQAGGERGAELDPSQEIAWARTMRAVSSIARSMEQRTREEDLVANVISQQLNKWRCNGDWNKFKCLELVFVCGWPNKQVAEHLKMTEQQVANYKSDFLDRTKTLLSR